MKRLVLFMLLASSILNVNAIEIAADQGREWRFRALLDDKPIGFHHFTLRQYGEEHVLESQAQFEVNVLFVKAYGYSHSATERWAGNCLKGITSSTDDNGTRYAVDGTVKGEQFVVTTRQGRSRLPDCVMTFAYWNPALLEQRYLLNSQTGDYVDVEVSFAGRETFTVGTEKVLAERYRLLAEGQRITLWYAAENHHWLGLESTTKDGYTLRYELLN